MRVRHSLGDMIRARILAIACGYEDCDDLDFLRFEIRRSSSPAVVFPTPARTCARSRRCRGWRTRPRLRTRSG